MTDPTNPFTTLSGARVSCMEMLQLILDGQASPEQRDYFLAHMDRCKQCFENYNVDMKIKQLLKERCCGGDCPEELIAKIKTEITQKGI